MNLSIGRLIKIALKISASDFSSAKNLFSTLKHQKQAARIRARHEKTGLHVPPFIIASIIRSCNLKCSGCYDKVKQECTPAQSELGREQWQRVFSEAKDLGVSFVLLAGGEPLLKKEVILECINFPELLFPVFTNGVLIDPFWIGYFSQARNILPILSIEGTEEHTDKRRGAGVHAKLTETMQTMRQRGILFGSSITLTSVNFDCVLSPEYIRSIYASGSRIFFLIEYVPFDASTQNLVLSNTQKAAVSGKLTQLRKSFSAIFLDFPGDEAAFGGCLASGRGFVHINASGGVESCPFAPYSDTSITERSLRQAIASPLLKKICALQESLPHTGGCTLFDNKEKVVQLLAEDYTLN